MKDDNGGQARRVVAREPGFGKLARHRGGGRGLKGLRVSVLRFSKFSRFSIFGIFQSSSFRCFVNGGQERSCSAAASGSTLKFHLINHVTRTMAM